jgi:superfamily II DNA or RNA helicase
MESKVISKRGYVIRKSILQKKELEQLKKELTMTPFTLPGFQQDTKKFKLYQENENKIYLPKAYALNKFGKPEVDRLENSGDDIDLEFSGSMRENQLPVIETFMSACKKQGGGLICLGCGFGKTIISLKIVSLLKKKTLIVVHKEFLLNQWLERINEFLPQARVGRIQQNKVDIVDKDIVIAMLQSISMKEYPKDTFDSFGFVALDECHHLGAEVFSKALPKITSKYMLGLTATPDRKDGMKKVFECYLGNIVYCIRGREPEKVLVRLINYYCSDSQYCKEQYNFKGQINSPKMINQLSEDPFRLKLIIEQIQSSILEGRKILILSDRRNHLTECKEAIDKLGVCSTGYYVGGSKPETLKESEGKDVILGTYSMASEGMDIPLLNTVILATPKSDIEQSVGRILRQKKEHRLVDPLIIDIIDQISNFKRQSLHRKRHYKKSNYIINQVDYPNKPTSKMLNQSVLVKFNECLL